MALFVASLDKKWVTYIHEALHLCPDATLDRYSVLSFLRRAKMPWGHQFYIILEKDDVWFLHQMVWLFGCHVKLNELDMLAKGKDLVRSQRVVWISAVDDLHGLQGGWAGQRFLWHPKGNEIPSSLKISHAKAPHMPMNHPEVKVEKLYELVIYTIAGEESLKFQKNRTLWNPVFN